MPRQVFPVLAVVAALLAANGALATLLPLRWMRAGVPLDAIAELAACVSAGGLAGALAGGRLIHRLGCRLSFVVLVAAFALANAASLWAEQAAPLGLARLAAGAALSGLYLLIESRLNAIATPERRSQILSSYMIVLYLAQAAGSACAGLGADTVLVAAIALILASQLGRGSFPSAPAARPLPAPGRSRADLTRLLTLSPDGYAIGLAAGVHMGCFYGLGPLFAERALADATLAGAFMSFAMIGGVAGLVATAKVSDRIGARATMTSASLAAGAAALAMAAMMHGGSAGLLILSAAFGAPAFCLYSLGSASVNAAVPAQLRVQANALYIVATGIGGTLGPLAAQTLLGVIDRRAPFVVIAGATLGAGLLVLLLGRGRTSARARQPCLSA